MRDSRWIVGLALGVVLLPMLLSVVGGVTAARGPTPATGSGPSYNATFAETGLPSGTNWSVHVAFIGCGCSGVHATVSSLTPSVAIPLPNGSYHYTVARVAGYVVVGDPRGTLTVAGAPPPTVAVAFVPVVDYTAEFTESGLPGGTSWTVNVAGNGQFQLWGLEHVSVTSGRSSMNFSLPNGTYHYTVDPVNGSFFNRTSHGSFVVAGASPTPILVRFVTPPTFSVTFTESGLLAGMSWSVEIHATGGGALVQQTSTSTGASIVFTVPNGSYLYRIGEVLGYTLSGSPAGTFTVAGAPVSIAVAFQQIGTNALYLVDFTESGLVGGTHWSVHVAAVHTFGPDSRETGSSTGPTVSFALPNGTYRYTVLPVRGYDLSGATGTVTVIGAAPPTVLVSFAVIPTYSITFNETGLPDGTNWTILVHTQSGAGSVYPVHVTERSNATTITFLVPNGTFCWVISPVHGFHITTGSATGTFVVAGASPATVYLVYSPVS